MFRTLVALLVSFCLIGCTSMQAVAVPSPGTPPSFSVGDTVQITTKAGASHTLEVTEVLRNAVVGTDESNKRIKVAFDQITAVEVKKFNTGKTVGAGTGISLLVVAVLFVVGVFAFGQAFTSSGD